MPADDDVSLSRLLEEDNSRTQGCSDSDESSADTNRCLPTSPMSAANRNTAKMNGYHPCCYRQRSLQSQDSGISLISSLDTIKENVCSCSCRLAGDGPPKMKVEPNEVLSSCICCADEEDVSKEVNSSIGVFCSENDSKGNFITSVVGNRQNHICYQGNMNRHMFERRRTNSDSVRDSVSSDDAFSCSKHSALVPTTEYRGDLLSSKDRDGNSAELVNISKNGKGCLSRNMPKFLQVTCSLSLVTFLIMVVLLVFNNANMSSMEEKITKLELAMEVKSGTFAMMQSSASSSATRPHAHFTLKSEEKIPLTAWKQRVLQWSRVTDSGDEGSQGLRYDKDSRGLIIHETGTYFVYNQVYVYRHVSASPKPLNKMTNHTLFHAIFKRPFNYPDDKRPILLAESTLSNCWNENANTQIHTSYQGIVVHLQENNELLVAMEDFNQSIDTLDPKSTYFGIFKL